MRPSEVRVSMGAVVLLAGFGMACLDWHQAPLQGFILLSIVVVALLAIAVMAFLKPPELP